MYSSDIKKILSWYLALKDMPLFTEEAADSSEPSLLEDASKKQETVEVKAKPVQKAAGKGATRLPRKAS